MENMLRAILDRVLKEAQAHGTRWEVYGPYDDDPARVWTEVYYLLK